MGRPDSIFGKFRETARCHDAQHGGGLAYALASQLIIIIKYCNYWYCYGYHLYNYNTQFLFTWTFFTELLDFYKPMAFMLSVNIIQAQKGQENENNDSIYE